jgi:hypothetical protein
MTRGRRSNTIHIVARTYDQAREQWVAASSRDRADLGVDKARAAAVAEAANYSIETPSRVGAAEAPGIEGRRDPVRFGGRMSRLNSKLQERPTPVSNSESIGSDPDTHRERVVHQQPRAARR